eukprot:CAMPEP_0118681124 /NCGR_PEP_ID=MMETSP0800-20121206/4758_1 /TAXON_ID=210618 ORGANISM="Striatella unipunctata, Strain CCMP2910" /NCGR_SAMPLE_ID=MMETSP0800 /ASSEMBLY_ACC=CAM_ASM_000638 /LENGTH=291 /DNA_ID=CAMNT_0006577373 /DNA_START=5 /DNA_END=880 /DNA_ORIENTATION=+
MATKKCLTLSFSGGGNLLPYHLGVASSLWLGHAQLPPVHAISGSSSGAIAAIVLSRMPHRIEEFFQRYKQQGGNALHHLKHLLHSQEVNDNDERPFSRYLHIATTNCATGELHLFSFESSPFYNISSNWNIDRILMCASASCRIPRAFHPIDLFFHATYPNQDGICIDGDYFVDGGIAAPAPPSPILVAPNNDNNHNHHHHVIVSPLLGTVDPPHARISPPRSGNSSGAFFHVTCRGGFKVDASFENLRAFVTAIRPILHQDELDEWYNRGIHDGEAFVKAHSKTRRKRHE